MSNVQRVLTSDGKPTDPATKDWIDQLADAIRKRCGKYPRMRMYAYRNNGTDYLAMDFDPTEPEIYGGFSITMSVSSQDKVSLELPKKGEFEIVPGVTDWVDAMTLANLLCQSLVAWTEFNPA